MFGVPLEELMGWDAEKGGVPRVVKDAVQYMREAGTLFNVIGLEGEANGLNRAGRRGFVPSLTEFCAPSSSTRSV